MLIRKKLRIIIMKLNNNTPCTFNVAFSDMRAVLITKAPHCTTVLLYCGVAGMISLAGKSPDGRIRVTLGGN